MQNRKHLHTACLYKFSNHTLIQAISSSIFPYSDKEAVTGYKCLMIIPKLGNRNDKTYQQLAMDNSWKIKINNRFTS